MAAAVNYTSFGNVIVYENRNGSQRDYTIGILKRGCLIFPL